MFLPFVGRQDFHVMYARVQELKRISLKNIAYAPAKQKQSKQKHQRDDDPNGKWML
jgi:hypothetical protein